MKILFIYAGILLCMIILGLFKDFNDRNKNGK